MSHRVRQVFWLTVVWVLLWGTPRPATIVGGVLVAVLVAWLFPLPPMRDPIPVRPLRLLSLASFVALDLLRSGVQIGWETLRGGGRGPAAAIIAVPLLAHSARVVAVLAGAVALTPGSYVLQIDRTRATFWVYALGVGGDGAVERVRREVLVLQRKVIAALGTADELAASDRGLAAARYRSAP